VAVRNANVASNLASTPEGAMAEVSEMLQRVRELAIQSANGANTAQDRENIDSEVKQLIAEIDRVVSTTTFNGINLLDGTFQRDMQIGYKGGETLNVDLESLGTTRLGSINGVDVAGSVTSASVKGVEATPTKTQLTFNGNDTYEFTLNIATKDGPGSYNIKGLVSNNSAADIAAKLNAAIRDSNGAGYVADGASTIEVSYSGNVLTVTNGYGGQIDIAANGANPFSASGSTIGYTSVVGGANSQDKVVGSANSFAGTTIENDNNFTAAVAATAQLTESGTATANDTVALKLTAGATILEFNATVTTANANDSLAVLKTAFDGLADKKGFELTHDTTNNTLDFKRADGVNFTVTADYNAGATLALSNDPGGAGAANAALADGVASAASGDGSIQQGDSVSNMYLEFVGADTYTFSFTDSDTAGVNTTGAFDVEYDGTSAGLSSVASQIETKLLANFDATRHSMSAVVEQGRIKISDANGKAFLLSGFASVGSGTVMASVDSGQGDATIGDGVLLDDTQYANTAQTNAAGTPTATSAKMTFSANDRYAFNISDGTSTAVVADFAVDISSAQTTLDVAGEINAKLKAAGMESIITASSTVAGEVILTHDLGKEISITNFRSESTGTVKVEAATGNTGFTKFLDDGNGGSAETVSGISVASATDASAAIDIVDRALEDVNIERSKLGAIINRLDYTVSNLGNIIVNTEASKSAITDADFAAESAKLAKNQILLQAGTAMLAQANASQQTVLSLLG